MSEREKLVEVIDRFLSVTFDGDEFEHRDAAIGLVLALEAAGVRLVPVESTMEMFAAADPIGMAAFHAGCTVNPDRIWQAMLAASPYAKENGNG